MAWREDVRRGIERWMAFTFDYPWRVILVVLVAVAGLASQLPNVRMETRVESFLHADDPLRVGYEAFRDEFGRDDTVLLTLEAPDVFAADFLERLRALHRDLEQRVPYLEEVTSLVNARETRGEDDALIVGELLEDWPETDAEREAVRRRALANRLYRNLLLSEDGGVTVVVVEPSAFADVVDVDDALAGFGEPAEGAGEAGEGGGSTLSEEQNAQVLVAVAEVVADHQAPGFRIHATGAGALANELQIMMQRDMALFTLLAVASIALFLGLLFRRLSGVFLPLLVVILSLLSSIALIPILGHSLGLPTQILPSFLVAIGVGGAVHLMAIFYQGLRAGMDPRAAVVHAGGHSGLAIMMTSFTTAGALVSFAWSDLAPVETLGVVAPLGVLIALVLTLTLLPALISALRIRADRSSGAAAATDLAPSQRLLVRCGVFALDHRAAVLVVSAALLVVGALGVAQIRFGHAPLEWFPEEHRFRVATGLADERLGGSLNLEVLVDTGVENGMHDPELHQRFDLLRERIESIEVGTVRSAKSISLADTLKEIHQALNENQPAFYVVPDDERLVAQELLLFENTGSDDLTDVVDPRFQIGRFSLRAPMVDAYDYAPYLERVGEDFTQILGDDVEVTFTGLMPILGNTLYAVMTSMATSYTIAFGVIALLMIVLIGDWRLGLAAMIPNLAPIILVLGAMGWAGRPLDTFTMLVGSIAIGLAVDDTIHFMNGFRRTLDETGDPRRAVTETLATTGQALLITSLVLTTGFAIYTFATMEPLFYFGVVTAAAITLAFVADILIAPALMTLLVEARRSRSVLAEEIR